MARLQLRRRDFGFRKDGEGGLLHLRPHREFELEARDTKLGPEEVTRDIPNVSETTLRNLDEAGVTLPTIMSPCLIEAHADHACFIQIAQRGSLTFGCRA